LIAANPAHEDSMGESVSLEFSRKPSEVLYMLGAFRPSPGLSESRPATGFSASWTGLRIEADKVARFNAIAGLPADAGISILHPHVFGFPLHMAILTHHRFPVPIWRVLQTRNTLVQRQSIPENAALDFEVRVTAQRVLDRGAEIDFHTTVRVEQTVAWESLVTFYTRGRFGEPEAPSPLASSPDVQGEVIGRWQMPLAGAWRVGRFIGDHNGIHHSDRYARLLGFRGALYHPPVVLGHCLSRLASMGSRPVARFDAWLKGPVYKGALVALRADPNAAGEAIAFALSVESDKRPSVIGRIAADPGLVGPLSAAAQGPWSILRT
jgi:hypothetical protein